MEFCDECLEVLRIISSLPRRKSQQRKTAFNDTKERCQLCRLIFHELKNSLCRTLPVSLDYMFGIVSRTEPQSLVVDVLLSFYSNKYNHHGDMRLALWADTGSPASGVLVTRPPICNGPKDIRELARDRLAECSSSHSGSLCSDTEVARLPTRVLGITGDPNAPTITLVESNGKQGRYCALSYCWGPVEKRPLTTTRANFREHTLGIAFETLPKTFHETVMLVQSIGINFLWIDSLCIIQDDEDDWRSESKCMAAIYRNATLVIAAAGSRDSTEGLSSIHRPKPEIIKAPYIVGGNVNGSFNIACLPEGDDDPNESPLRERAWAFQEWHLARRLLFFMPGGVSWKCNTLEATERGRLNTLDLYDDLSWYHLLEEYSSKKLTYPSDRLPALQGIVTAMQETRQDRFLHEYGIWENQLMQHLLWMKSTRRLEISPLGLPTWSWAATEGAKRWFFKGYSDPLLVQVPDTLKLSTSGSLNASGHMIDTEFVPGAFPLWAKSKLLSEKRPTIETMSGIPNWVLRATCLIRTKSSDNKILGTAFLDGDLAPHTRCFFVTATIPILEPSSFSASSSNDEEVTDEPEHYTHTDDTGTESLQDNNILFETSESTDNEAACELVEVDNGNIFSTLCQLTSLTSHRYLALLLRPVGTTKYERVGLALLIQDAYELEEKEFLEFEIV